MSKSDYISIDKCDCCGSSSSSFKTLDAVGYIVRCQRCGYKFTNPRNNPEKEFVVNDYNYAHKMSLNVDVVSEIKLFLSRYNLIKRYIKPKDSILDVGAGYGSFLHVIKHFKPDCSVRGTEVSDTCIRVAQRCFEIDLLKGTLEDVQFDEKFDVISMWHVLEHVQSPTEVLQQCFNLLKDGGHLIIAVPNESILGRGGLLRNFLKRTLHSFFSFYKPKLKCMYPDYEKEGNWHLSHFTPAVLKQYFKNNGFKLKKYTLDKAIWGKSHLSFKSKLNYYCAKIVFLITTLNFYNTQLYVLEK